MLNLVVGQVDVLPHIFDCTSDDAVNSPLHVAAMMGDDGVLSGLLATGVPADLVRTYGSVSGVTALMMAAGTEHARCVDVLARAGADVRLADAVGLTAMMWCACKGRPGCIDALVRAGADVNDVDRKGFTAVTQAAAVGHVGCVDALVRAGADVNITDTNGRTTIMAARDACCFF